MFILYKLKKNDIYSILIFICIFLNFKAYSNVTKTHNLIKDSNSKNTNISPHIGMKADYDFFKLLETSGTVHSLLFDINMGLTAKITEKVDLDIGVDVINDIVKLYRKSPWDEYSVLMPYAKVNFNMSPGPVPIFFNPNIQFDYVLQQASYQINFNPIDINLKLNSDLIIDFNLLGITSKSNVDYLMASSSTLGFGLKKHQINPSLAVTSMLNISYVHQIKALKFGCDLELNYFF